MVEPSMGKQHLGPPKLRIVQQPSDSDTVVPGTLETAPESDHGGKDAGLSAEDLALMVKCSHSKSASHALQTSTTSLNSIPFTRPASAKTGKSVGAYKRAPNKITFKDRKEESLSMKPLVHPDTAIPSIEAPAKSDVCPGTKVSARYVHTLTNRRCLHQSSAIILAADADDRRSRH